MIQPSDHPASAAVIKLKDAVSKRGSFTLGPCTVDVGPGLSIIWGESGSGKSTLLSLIAGLAPAAAGQVFYSDIDISSIPDSTRAQYRRALVAVASQKPFFLSRLSLKENVALALRIRGVTTEQPEDWLLKAGLALHLDKLPAGLSGGELSRAETARAFAGARRVVCLDEPTAMLDEMNSARIRNLIQDAVKTRYVVCATHDPHLRDQATTVWQLDHGRLGRIS